MLSVSKHVVGNDMSFFMKANRCQEKQFYCIIKLSNQCSVS